MRKRPDCEKTLTIIMIYNKYPTLKGFDNRGLYRMMQFYDTYKDNEIVSPPVSQIS